MKRLLIMFSIMFVVIAGCSNNEGKEKTNVEKNDSVLAGYTDEEMVYFFFDAIKNGEEETIYDNAFEGQQAILESAIDQLKIQMESTDISIEVEKIIGKVTVENYSLMLLINKLIDKDGNTINYITAQIPLLDVDGQYQYAWDIKKLPDEIAKHDEEVQKQVQDLLEKNEKVQETIKWMNDQNFALKDAYNEHMEKYQ